MTIKRHNILKFNGKKFHWKWIRNDFTNIFLKKFVFYMKYIGKNQKWHISTLNCMFTCEDINFIYLYPPQISVVFLICWLLCGSFHLSCEKKKEIMHSHCIKKLSLFLLNYFSIYRIMPNKCPWGAAFFKKGAFIKVSKIEVNVT